MLEILAIIFLSRKNAALAIKKGLKPGTWKLYTVLAWIVTEIIGMILGITLLGIGTDNLFGLMGIGLASAFGGYLIVRAILEKKPDAFDDEINNIGINDLRPPRV